MIEQPLHTFEKIGLLTDHTGLFAFNDTFLADIRARDTDCGFADFREKYLQFPPTAFLPSYEDLPNVNNESCVNIYNDVFEAVTLINPCFDIYQVATTCPVLWDVLGCEYTFLIFQATSRQKD